MKLRCDFYEISCHTSCRCYSFFYQRVLCCTPAVMQKGVIRSSGVLAFMVIGLRRGPTMLNRMCSEAELAAGMQPIISSSKRANVTLLFAPFGDGFGSFDLPQVPFPSVTPHAVKHSSPPSGTGLTPICYTPELRMNPKDHQSECKRPSIAR